MKFLKNKNLDKNNLKFSHNQSVIVNVTGDAAVSMLVGKSIGKLKEVPKT